MAAPTPHAFHSWRTLGFPRPPEAISAGVRFKNSCAVLEVTVLSPDIVRIRFSPTPEFARDHSYTVENFSGDPGALEISPGDSETILTTSALQITLHHAPFAITIADLAGNVIDQDETTLGTSWAGPRVQVSKYLDDAAAIYGFGEKNGRLNKRGICNSGAAYAMWATDAFAYDGGADPLYANVPFYLNVKAGRAHGIYLDNTYRTFFDVGHLHRGALSFGAEGGELDYYFINGPHPRDVVARYTRLTGLTPLPPRWALGYHQCRWSYYPESRVRKLANDFRHHKVPGEVLWLDVHHLDGYAPFTWDRERFPDPRKMIADLHAQGFRVVPIVDPHIKAEAGHAPYDEGLIGDHFVRYADGRLYQAPVWPSNAEKNPRQSVFPDFTRDETRAWWGALFKDLLDLGADGIWNDMNEPTVFVPPWKTFPSDVMHHNEGSPAGHDAVHNVYGMLNSRATYEGLLRLRPDQRPFILTRSTFAGGQRYAALWTGDNVSEWTHLQQSIPMLLGLSLSGFNFIGADIGGFAGIATPELFTRWLQAAVLSPFMRAHTMINTPDQEPWVYGEHHLAHNRRAIELRYELLPHIYSVMAECCAAGLPVLRPLFLEYPEDKETEDRDDCFLFGRDLLAAPVLKEQQSRHHVYLPASDWYDLWTGKVYAGGRSHALDVTLESMPLFVRAGGFIFRQPVVQHTGEMPGQPLIVAVYPHETASEAAYYEDDGASFAYRRGGFWRRAFKQRRDGRRLLCEAGAVEGNFQPAPRDLIWRVHTGSNPPASVTLNGSRIADWKTTDAGQTEIRLPDTREAIRLVIET
jgi:alpha-glucosidase